MTYDEAIEARVSLREAIAEVQNHGFNASATGTELIEDLSGTVVAEIGADGLVSGADVLAWLGY